MQHHPLQKRKRNKKNIVSPPNSLGEKETSFSNQCLVTEQQYVKKYPETTVLRSINSLFYFHCLFRGQILFHFFSLRLPFFPFSIFAKWRSFFLLLHFGQFSQLNAIYVCFLFSSDYFCSIVVYGFFLCFLCACALFFRCILQYFMGWRWGVLG